MEISRLSRLTSIMTMLQSKRLITASDISKKFGISIRTAYRDIRSLEEAGIPIYTEEGKGYSLVSGFSLPPVAFTEVEANALITAEKLLSNNKDASLAQAYADAITKIKAVLKYSSKDKAQILAERIHFRNNQEQQRTSSHLTQVQLAITNSHRCQIEYKKIDEVKSTTRQVEPFALYNTNENWILVAHCLLRKEFRSFRLDRILSLELLNETFEPSKMSLEEYFEICKKKFSNP